jgi:hypothetical protein
MMPRPALFSLTLSLPLLLATPASAQHGPAPIGIHLDFTRGPDTRQCPNEADLRGEIAAQLGHDPFTDSGPRRLVTSVHRRKTGAFVATTELLDSSGAPLGERGELVGGDCRALFGLLAARIEVLVTLASPPPASPAPAAPPPPEPPALVLPPVINPPESPPPPPSALRLRLGVGSGIEVGVGPSPSPTFALHIGLQAPVVSVAFEARTDLPLTGSGEDGARVRSQVVSGSALACFHGFQQGIFFGCAMFTAGVFTGGDERGAMGATSQIYSAAGPRLGLAIPFSARRFAIYIAGDVLGTLHPIRVLFDEMPVWKNGSVAAAFQVGFFAFR